MSRFRSFVFLQLPLLTISALLLSGALAQQSPPPNKPAAPTGSAAKTAPSASTPLPKPDPNAIAALTKAIEARESEKLGYVDTNLWEQVDIIGLSFQASGAYLSGPKDRLRLEIKVRLGNTDSRLLVVSDGKWVWNEVQLAKDKPMVHKYSLEEVYKNLNVPNVMPTFAEEFYRGQSFRGVEPLLQSLSKQMTFTKFEHATWKGKEVYKLTASWTPDMSKAMAQPGQPWPAFTPRTCYLFLGRDKSNPPYWPYRLEWWGPPGSASEDKILMQMEFRDPQFFAPKVELPKRFAQAFSYNPGKLEVNDVTEQYVKGRVLAPK